MVVGFGNICGKVGGQVYLLSEIHLQFDNKTTSIKLMRQTIKWDTLSMPRFCILWRENEIPVRQTKQSMIKGYESNGRLVEPVKTNQSWGFDPLELLDTVEFPNDRFEYEIRRSKDARLDSIRRIPLESTPCYDARRRTAPSTTDPSVTDQDLNEKFLLRDQLAKSAAAIMIQSVWRGITIRRKYLAVVQAKLSLLTLSNESGFSFKGLPDAHDVHVQVSMIPVAFYELLYVQAQELLLQRYFKHCHLVEMQGRLPPTFPDFCSIVIQSLWRMFSLRRTYLLLRQMGKEEMDEQVALLLKRGERVRPATSAWDIAAMRIQNAWKRYYNLKIYRFYRDLIKFRERGDPRRLLKFINPTESRLVDGASGIHVRFRLGGELFPPLIVYKIFVHRGMIDMNSFSPRDYTANECKQLLPQHLFAKVGGEGFPTPHDGWYRRFENNGWRPVSDKLFFEAQWEVTTRVQEQKAVHFHHSKTIRKQEMDALRRRRKVEWMRKMYEEGKRLSQQQQHKHEDDQSHESHEKEQKQGQSHVSDNYKSESTKKHEDDRSKHTSARRKKNETASSDDDTKLAEQVQDVLAESLDHEFLMRWSRALDFDEYVANWMSLATTGRSDDPSTFEIDIELPSQTEEGNVTSNIVEGGGLLAEIELFKSIQEESQIGTVDGKLAGTDDRKPSRPWSAKTHASLSQMVLS
ncbi:hypothetical protein BJ742DRAFT_864615 [Cladochytrium replicatum]|nr:hypothetical protein BJ742DRAFT_864615 [Cladochytrium replicatum]